MQKLLNKIPWNHRGAYEIVWYGPYKSLKMRQRKPLQTVLTEALQRQLSGFYNWWDKMFHKPTEPERRMLFVSSGQLRHFTILKLPTEIKKKGKHRNRTGYSWLELQAKLKEKKKENRAQELVYGEIEASMNKERHTSYDTFSSGKWE